MSEILIIERIFPKYRKEILDELHKNVDFVIIHSVDNSGIEQINAPYSKKIKSFQYSNNYSHQFLYVFPYIIKNKPKIITHDFAISIASLIPTLFLSKILNIKFILWGHGYDRATEFFPEKYFKDKIRLFLMKKADAIILYGEEAKVKLSKYVNNEKLFVAHNCLNTNKLNSIRANLECEGRENVKKRIGFINDYNLIFIGRILQSKKPQLLIDIYEILKYKYNNSLCIHFVGDGDYLNELKKIVKNKNIEGNIKFHGAIHDDVKSGEMLYCSDLMIMPGFVGLAINHAFNFDCPVVTFQQKGNGPEIEYLKNNETGYIVETHSIENMALIISEYLDSSDIQFQMRKNIRNEIETICSIENFIEGFLNAIKFVN